MTDIMTVPRLPLDKWELFPTNPMAVMPPRPGTPGSVRLTSSVTLTSRLPHDLSRLSATSLITLQLAERVPLRTFYDGLFRFPCHYGMQLYSKAAEIFDRLQSDYVPGSKCNLAVEDIEFSTNEEKKLAFELAYAAMKYEEVLRQTLDDVGFAVKFTEFQHDLSVASVILYDYQDRRFQRRRPVSSDQQAPLALRRLEEALFLLRTRLSAALARIRILHDAPNLHTLLPESVQPRQQSKHRPLYGWLNNNKVSSEEALDSLWTTLKVLQPSLTESSFRHDQDFQDLIIFEQGWKETIEKTSTFKHRWIVLQEKACCLPAYAAVQELQRLFQREPELRGSLLQTGAGSGRTLAHVLSCLPPGNGITRLLAMAGDRRAVVQKQLDDLGVPAPTARVLSGGLLTGVRCHDLRDVVAVLVTPETTHTALADPVDWVVEEGGDISLLRELSMDPSRSGLPQRVSALVTDQNETLLRALRLPRVRVVVYATHSANRAENEEVVFGVVDEVNEEQQRRWQAERHASKLEMETPPDKLYELRQLVTIPDEDVSIPFLVLPQTPESSGVFIAVIVKNMDFIRREDRSVIDDALAMGLLERLGPPLDAAEQLQSQSSRRKLRRPKAGARCERLVGAGRRPGEQQPPVTRSLPAAATPHVLAPLHVQVPHLHDCTCAECARQRRWRWRRQRQRTPSQLAAGADSAVDRSSRFGAREALVPRRSGVQSLGSVGGSGVDSGADSLTSLSADGGRLLRPTVLALQAPTATVLSPIPGSGRDWQRSGPDWERAQRRERDAVGQLTTAAGASRDAIRDIQRQMAHAAHGARRDDPTRVETLRDLRELERARMGAHAHLPWAAPEAQPALQLNVRQLLTTRGRPQWRWSLPEERPPEERPPERPVAVAAAGRLQHGRRRQLSQPPEPAEQGDAGAAVLSRQQLRSRHQSLGPPLAIHKINIGETLPSSFHQPIVF